ncbi:MAG: thymidylate synthase [Patescibacteria group bacterium]|nr:thymidylate synthase [Patescibacteria group bacterium]
MTQKVKKPQPPDMQYRQLLQLVLDQGLKSYAQQGTKTISLIGASPMRFRLAEGFPMITERNMAPVLKNGKPTVWQQAIAELTGFINGARTQQELEKFGCFWWQPWVTEKKCAKRGLVTGDLGPGSYGAAFHDFPTSEGPTYNQFQNILEQMRQLPHLKTHFISPWIPQYTIRGKGKQQKVVVCPCHGWLHLRIFGKKLILHMFQRSGDLPVGVPSNMVQYAALTLMIAQVLDLEPYEYVHTISDAHIFVDQVPMVKQMLEREPKPLPTMRIKKSRQREKDLFAFRFSDFELFGYDPHPGLKLPVAV